MILKLYQQQNETILHLWNEDFETTPDSLWLFTRSCLGHSLPPSTLISFTGFAILFLLTHDVICRIPGVQALRYVWHPGDKLQRLNDRYSCSDPDGWSNLLGDAVASGFDGPSSVIYPHEARFQVADKFDDARHLQVVVLHDHSTSCAVVPALRHELWNRLKFGVLSIYLAISLLRRSTEQCNLFLGAEMSLYVFALTSLWLTTHNDVFTLRYTLQNLDICLYKRVLLC